MKHSIQVRDKLHVFKCRMDDVDDCKNYRREMEDSTMIVIHISTLCAGPVLWWDSCPAV